MIEIQSNRHTISIAPEGITVFFGPTGVGKTTLLRQIAGHIPMQGKFSVNEQVIESADSSIPPQERGFAYVSQSSSLVRQFTVERNLQLSIAAARKPLNQKLIDEINAICRIQHLLDRQASQISGGEAQQVCLAMGLLSQPDLMLLDEPMSAMDMRLKYDILAKFKRWTKEHSIPVIYVSHDVNEIALIADQMAIISLEKPVQVRSYQNWLADVNSEFVTHSLAVNTLFARYVRTEHNLNLMALKNNDEIQFWAQGDIDHEREYIVELPITDVSVSLVPMATSSILNQLKAEIETVSEPVNGYQFVSLRIAEQVVTARLTEYSVQHLSLFSGQTCFMCFKTPRVMPLQQ